jgi:hypothetical protein
VGPDTHAWSGYDASATDPETARSLWDISQDILKDFLD